MCGTNVSKAARVSRPSESCSSCTGRPIPSETGFDIDLPGGAWADLVARKGYDVYLVDVRGYGRSTRPAAMDAPAAENPPFATTVDAVKDVSAAVDFILKRRGISKLNLRAGRGERPSWPAMR